MNDANTADNVPQGCNACSACPYRKKFSIGRVNIALALGILAILVACYAYFYGINIEGYFGSFMGKHAVLIIRINNDFKDLDPDAEQIRNALKVGGYVELATDKSGAEFIRSVDVKFDLFGASDANGEFYIRPAVLNWISSHGWKLQQVWCINFNEENMEYIFVR